MQSRVLDLGVRDNSEAHSGAQSSICKNFSDRLKVIPPFHESDVLEFFNSFEKTALGFKWPRNEWSIVAQTAFKGKARKLYDSLSFSQCSDYDLLKSEILKVYTLTPEAYRQQFRKLQKKSEESHTDFATRLEHSFLMWLRSTGVLGTDDSVDGTKLYNLVLVEQFLMRIPKDTEFYLRDKEMDEGELKVAASKADHFTVNRRATYGCAGDLSDSRSLLNHLPPSNPSYFQSRGQSQTSPRLNHPKSNPQTPFKTNTTSFPASKNNLIPPLLPNYHQNPRYSQPSTYFPKGPSPYFCNHCRKPGHTEDRCWVKSDKNVGKKSNVFNFTEVKMPASGAENYVTGPRAPRDSQQSSGKTLGAEKPAGGNVVLSSISPSAMDTCAPFIFPGTVTLNGSIYDVTILRDTAATGTLLVNPTGEPLDSKECVLIRGVAGFNTYPRVRVDISCDLVKATVDVGVVESLPAPGVTLLLGNDVAGAKVFPNPVLSEVPVTIPATVNIEKQHPEVFHVCAVTRSMSRATESLPDAKEEEEEEVNVESVGDDVLPSVEDNSLADIFNIEIPPLLPNVTVEQLRVFQETDPKIYPLRRVAVQESECDQEKGECFYLKNDVLWRRWRPPHVEVDDGMWDTHQIIIPQQCRQQLLEMAHRTPLAGHLGVRKTLQRLRTHFYWPRMTADVAQYIRACHSCQVTGKPNQAIPVSPLIPIPTLQPPFGRIIIDIVGPLPKTSDAHVYLLTILDAATRYPEAVPLRSVSSKVVVRELLLFFYKVWISP